MIHDISSTQLADGLTEEQLELLAENCEHHFLAAGEQLCQSGDLLTRLYIVNKGCLIIKSESNKSRPVLTMACTGESIGEYSLLANEPILADAYAEFDTTLLSIARQPLLDLIEKIPRIRENLVNSFNRKLKSLVNGERVRRFAKSVAFVRAAGLMPNVIGEIAMQLQIRGERVIVLSKKKTVDGDFEWRPLELGPKFARQLYDVGKEFDRAIIDLPPQAIGRFSETVDQCDEVFWAFASRNDGSLGLLDEYLKKIIRAKTATAHVKRICVLPPGELIAPKDIADSRLMKRDFILPSSQTGSAQRLQKQGIDRLVRHLCDVKIGLALAGGGAKGLAHFGVLRALDRAGISFDIMSGTSAGAMFGLSYASGLETEFMIRSYTRDLTPPRSFRVLPGGDRLYMIWKFRTRSWTKMLRPYFHDWTIEQLPIQFYSVAVDLVRGKQVISESGNMIEAMLDSLNLPGIAKPILKNGKAMVDGGVLNNLPADVLAHHNADLVVGVNVGSGLAQEFGKNRPAMSTSEMKMPGALEILFRIIEVIGKGSSEYQRSSTDLLIQPDTSQFSFSDFTKGNELADIGEAAMEASIDELQNRLVELTRFKSYRD